MAKKKVDIKIVNFGIYDKFDKDDEQLPEIIEFSDKIPARLEIEFGMIVEITKARGEVISWRIGHPPFKNSRGCMAPPFTGEFHVNSPVYTFFLGDTIWEPIDDKLGIWDLSISWNGTTMARKKLKVVSEDEYMQSTHHL